MPPTPSLTTHPTRLRPWLILWSLLLLAQVLLLSNNAALDSLAWRSTRWFCGDQGDYQWQQYKYLHAHDPNPPFYQRLDPPMTKSISGQLQARFYSRTEHLWRLFRDLGEPYLTVVLVITVSLFDPRKWKAGLLLTASASISGLAGELIRVIAGRYRPDAIINRTFFVDGSNHWQFLRGFHEGSNLSWPSGHSTLAFATAATLIYLFPKGRWLFLTLAALCALARIVMNAHFYADVLFGAALGYTLGWFTTLLLDRLLTQPTPPAMNYE